MQIEKNAEHNFTFFARQLQNFLSLAGRHFMHFDGIFLIIFEIALSLRGKPVN